MDKSQFGMIVAFTMGALASFMTGHPVLGCICLGFLFNIVGAATEDHYGEIREKAVERAVELALKSRERDYI